MSGTEGYKHPCIRYYHTNHLQILSHLLPRIFQEAWPSWQGGGPAR